jgi:hypothetical protein
VRAAGSSIYLPVQVTVAWLDWDLIQVIKRNERREVRRGGEGEGRRREGEEKVRRGEGKERRR